MFVIALIYPLDRLSSERLYLRARNFDAKEANAMPRGLSLKPRNKAGCAGEKKREGKEESAQPYSRNFISRNIDGKGITRGFVVPLLSDAL